MKQNNLRKALARFKAGQRLQYPPSGKKYVWPSKVGKVRVK